MIAFQAARLSRWLGSFGDRQDGLRRILTNTGWLILDRILRMGVGVVVGIWVARYLGPAQFGLYNYAAAFVGLFSVLATLGLDTITIREIVHAPSSKSEVLGTVFFLRVAGGAATVVTAVTAMTLLRPSDGLARSLVGLIAASSLAQSLDVIDLWFQSQVLSKYTVLAKNAAFLVVAAVRVALLLYRAPLTAFAAAVLGESILGALGLLFLYRLTDQKIAYWKVSFDRAILLLRESWPLMLSGFTVMIYMRIDQVMLGQYLGDKSVGIYAAATKISEVWYFIPTAVVSSATPAIMRSRALGEETYYRTISNCFYILNAVAFAIAILMTFLSKYLIHILYGSTYSGAALVLTIHIWAAVFVFLGVVQHPWNINEGLGGVLLQRCLGGAIANILLNLVLIPAYGPAGAAWATVVSQALAAFVFNGFDKRTRRIFKLQFDALTFRRYLWDRGGCTGEGSVPQ